MKTWQKGGLIGILVFIGLFLIEGTIKAITNGGKCIIVCPAGGGACAQSFSHCFTSSISYNFFHATLFQFFAGMHVSQILLNNLFRGFAGLIVTIVCYFLIGVLTAIIVKKIKSR
ncbi:MAG: hypothetical protein ABIJ20_04975 [Nanoarchaeota archaeon]|nr:hypothetical protein [Nanoarchaeota archaeon]MBU1445347.1 hypothetical protein [Nanoarchaeota archaeon]MBU2420375.1 hypothetical protein [Nanoarchaeota archaeon]MBU2475731.1 hypothetical protein [Nanoarchaeota archaeon]